MCCQREPFYGAWVTGRGGGGSNRPYANSSHTSTTFSEGWGRGNGVGVGGQLKSGPWTPTKMAENERLFALIILSHVCWGKRKSKGGGGHGGGVQTQILTPTPL